MAIAFKIVGTVAQNSSTATMVVTVPAVADGDFLVMNLSGFDNVGPAAPTPAGWNLIDSNWSAATNITQAMFWRVASSEPASYTVTKSGGGASFATQAVILAYTGVASSSQIRSPHGNVTGAAGATSPTPLLLSGMVTGDMAIISYGQVGGSAMTPPGGAWNTRVNSTSGASVELLIVDKLDGTDRPTAGGVAGGTWNVQSQALAAPSTNTGNFFPFLGGI